MTSSSLRDVPITIVRCSRSVSFVVSFVKDCEKQLKEADDCFKQCDIETRMLPSSLKASVVQKVETLRKEYESKKRQLANMKVQVERSELMGGGAVCVWKLRYA